jgi:metallo-beta-lactamase class B
MNTDVPNLKTKGKGIGQSRPICYLCIASFNRVEVGMKPTRGRRFRGMAAAMALVAMLGSRGAAAAPAAGTPQPLAAAVAPEADFPALKGMCDVQRATFVPDFSRAPPLRVPRVLPRARVFDNLYFLGNEEVSSWAITTGKGIILIDSLDNEREVKDAIEPGLRAFGLDPADIRYVVVTHAHGDHYGGARYLAATYGAKIVMSEADWNELAKPKLQFDLPEWGRPPTRDIAVRDGDKLRLGSTTIQLMVARAHTPGTINLIFSVTDRGVRHRAMLWGGMAFNFGPVTERLQAYAAAAERARKLAAASGVDVLLASHSSADASRTRIAGMLASPGGPNPFVIGGGRVDAVLARMAECARASAAASTSLR